MAYVVLKPFRNDGRDFKTGDPFPVGGVAQRTLELLRSQRFLTEAASPEAHEKAQRAQQREGK